MDGPGLMASALGIVSAWLVAAVGKPYVPNVSGLVTNSGGGGARTVWPIEESVNPRITSTKRASLTTDKPGAAEPHPRLNELKGLTKINRENTLLDAHVFLKTETEPSHESSVGRVEASSSP